MLGNVALVKGMDDEISDLTNLINEKLWMLLKYLRILACHMYSAYNFDMFNRHFKQTGNLDAIRIQTAEG